MPSSEAAGAILTVDLAALVANYRRLRAELGTVECAAVVKADAYGLGLAAVARALAGAGCRSFFVAHQIEGQALRALLAEADIYILHGAMAGTEAGFAADRLIPVLSTPAQIDGWLAAVPNHPAALHLDSGLNRLGLSPAQLDDLLATPERLAALELTLVLSHLAAAEAPENPANREQLDRFRALKAKLAAPRSSLANSSGIFLGPEYHFDLGRAGVALYGVNPTPGRPNPMLEVVRLQGKILALREIDRGEGVGYGAAYRAAGPRRIATVPVGYADGYFRALGNNAFAALDGQRIPVVGRVSMDLITLDVTALPAGAAEVGRLVDLIGGAVPLEAVAAAAGTIEYEILTALGPRYHRHYLEDEVPTS
jgi:alanine racemase